MPFVVRHLEVMKIMGDWFKPLRRKLGLVSLVTALLFLGAWGRSQFQAAVIPLWNDGNIWNDLFLNATGVGFRRYQHSSPFGCYTTINGFVIPYWFVITPLTVVSTCLFFSQRRDR